MNGICRIVTLIFYIQFLHYRFIEGKQLREMGTRISEKELFTIEWNLSFGDKSRLNDLLVQRPPATGTFQMDGYPLNLRVYLKIIKDLEGDKYVVVYVESDNNRESSMSTIILDCAVTKRTGLFGREIGPRWEKHYFTVKNEIRALPSKRIEDFNLEIKETSELDLRITISEAQYMELFMG